MPEQIDYSKYPATEVRRPRNSFTKALRKICAKLDANSSHTITFNDTTLGRSNEIAHMEAQALWVVGSYARGALTCGDLDLVLQTKLVKGYRPSPATIARTFLGARPDVRVYHGTPKENSSGATFSEAVCLWKPGMNWTATLAGMPQNPQATRFASAHDVLPLRVEQVGMSFETLEEVIQMHAGGILSWSFTPFREVTPVYEGGNEAERRFLERMSNESTMKRKLAPLVLGFARQLAAKRLVCGDIQLRYTGDIELGSLSIGVDNLRLDVEPLNTLEASYLVLLPALSKRGPNGFWTIERGPNHPLMRLFANARTWIHARKSGAPVLVEFGSYQICETATGADFFSDQASAQAAADSLNEDARKDGSGEEYEYVPKEVRGGALLELLTQLDVAATEAGDLALTREGQHYCNSVDSPVRRILSAEEFAAFFCGEPVAVLDSEAEADRKHRAD